MIPANSFTYCRCLSFVGRSTVRVNELQNHYPRLSTVPPSLRIYWPSSYMLRGVVQWGTCKTVVLVTIRRLRREDAPHAEPNGFTPPA